MAFIPGAGLVQVVMQFSQFDGEICENVFGVDSGTGAAVDATYLGHVCTAFITWFNTGDGANKYQQWCGSGTTLLSVTAKDLTVQDGGEVTVSANQGGGDSSGTPLPNGVTYCVTAKTGLGGRSGRGRTYLVGMTSSQQDSSNRNKTTASHSLSAVAMMQSLIGAVHAITGGSSALVVLSRRHNNAPRSSLLATPVVFYSARNLFLDYQRRRAPAHNRHH